MTPDGPSSQSFDERVPTSVILERLLCQAPPGYVSIDWLMQTLSVRSFGVLLLLLGLLAMLPLVSPIAGALLLVPALQMMLARPFPVFPRRLSRRRLPTERLFPALRRLIPALRFMERFVRPRWQTPFRPTTRVVGGCVLCLGAALFVPIPLSNVPIGFVVILVAFAYLEEDGILLVLALLGALGLFAIGGAAAWGTIAAGLSLT